MYDAFINARVVAGVVSCTGLRVGCYFPAKQSGAIGGIRNHPVRGDNKACRDWKVVNSAPGMITAARFPGALNDTLSLTRATREKRLKGEAAR